jgi:hypothetical protein
MNSYFYLPKEILIRVNFYKNLTFAASHPHLHPPPSRGRRETGSMNRAPTQAGGKIRFNHPSLRGRKGKSQSFLIKREKR